MLLAYSREFIHSRDTGLAFGIIETANGLAIILAPPLCGIVYNHNPQNIFWISAIGLALVGLISFFQLSKFKRKDPNWL
jgi:MFS family permease